MRRGAYWEFAAADNGIEAEYFDRIFEMFRRLHTREQYEGTGIGLAVVKRIVERRSGSVRVDSTPGVGSTFFFDPAGGVNRFRGADAVPRRRPVSPPPTGPLRAIRTLIYLYRLFLILKRIPLSTMRPRSPPVAPAGGGTARTLLE